MIHVYNGRVQCTINWVLVDISKRNGTVGSTIDLDQWFSVPNRVQFDTVLNQFRVVHLHSMNFVPISEAVEWAVLAVHFLSFLFLLFFIS